MLTPFRSLLALGILVLAACGDGATEPEPPQPNRAPVAQGSIPAQTVAVSESVTVSVASAFTDPDGDALTHAATSSAPGVASVAVSGANVTVTGLSAGAATVTVTASDPGGLSAQLSFEVTVPNRAPAVTDTIPAQTVPVGDSVTQDLAEHFSDPDGDALTYAAESSAADVASVMVSGSVVTVTGVSKGTTTITVTASDPEGLSAQQEFQVTVPNRAPAVADSIPSQTVHAGDSVSLDLAGHFSDLDGDELTYTAESSAAGVASVMVSGSVVTITGMAGAGGTATVALRAADPEGLSATQSFGVTVVWRISGTGDGVFEVPEQVRQARIEGEYTGHTSNFIIWCGTYVDAGGLLVNELMGTAWEQTAYSGVHSMRRSYNNRGDPCGTVEVRHSEGVDWSITDVTDAAGSAARSASNGTALLDLVAVRHAVETRTGPTAGAALIRHLDAWVAAETLAADATRDPDEALEIRQGIEAVLVEIAKLRNERGGGR